MNTGNHSHDRHHGRHGGFARFAMREGIGGRDTGARGDFGGGRGFGGGGRRRVFDGGELRLLLLALVGEQSRHGYDLIRAIDALSGGAYAPSPGVVYPTLTLLVDMGLIEEIKSEGARKQFAITEEGRAHVAERSEELAALMQRLAALGAFRERTDGASIRRAMHNLRTVLQNRLGQDDVPKETLHEAIAILDAAAQRIERL